MGVHMKISPRVVQYSSSVPPILGQLIIRKSNNRHKPVLTVVLLPRVLMGWAGFFLNYLIRLIIVQLASFVEGGDVGGIFVMVRGIFLRADNLHLAAAAPAHNQLLPQISLSAAATSVRNSVFATSLRNTAPHLHISFILLMSQL